MISNIKPNFEDFYFKNIKVLNYLGNYEKKWNNKFSEIIIPSQKNDNNINLNDLYVKIIFLRILWINIYSVKWIKTIFILDKNFCSFINKLLL